MYLCWTHLLCSNVCCTKSVGRISQGAQQHSVIHLKESWKRTNWKCCFNTSAVRFIWSDPLWNLHVKIVKKKKKITKLDVKKTFWGFTECCVQENRQSAGTKLHFKWILGIKYRLYLLLTVPFLACLSTVRTFQWVCDRPVPFTSSLNADC